MEFLFYVNEQSIRMSHLRDKKIDQISLSVVSFGVHNPNNKLLVIFLLENL